MPLSTAEVEANKDQMDMDTSFRSSHPELWQCMDDLANSEIIATMTQTI